ncbi:MAG TPA: hypothetical protein VGS23_08580 [Thermoplasmata archaeon]|nr:hypothetical protein [Thermoplasmata archaeon]
MSSCFEHLDAITQDHVAAGTRMAKVRAALDAYAQGGTAGRSKLAAELGELAEKEFDQVRYESAYPLSCLQATLPDPAAERVAQGFRQSAPAIADLDRHIQGYLGRPPARSGTPLKVRCPYPGCTATALAETCPSNDGHLAIRPPEGWRPVAHPPHINGRSPIVIDIDFYCPDHLPAPLPVASPVAEPVTSSPGRSAASPSQPAETCSCCDPIAPTLA